MSRESAHRLRARSGAESFAHAWDRVLTPPGSGRVRAPAADWRKITNPELLRLAETGRVQPVLHLGKMLGIRRKANDSALLRLLGRMDARPRLDDFEGW